MKAIQNSKSETQNRPGVGIGFREQFRADVFLNQDKVDFLEITTDHYLDAKPQKFDELKLLKEHFPLIPHSLELSLGSAEGIDEEYLEKVAEIVEFVAPEWFSDHLCFTRSGGVKIGHLAPVPYTTEAVKVFVKNITKVKSLIKTPLILENITYLVQFPSSEMSESAFIKTILEETDCGLLLDVTNLYINSQNFGFDWRKFLDEIPLERVVQLHFVGAHRSGKRLIDAHANKTDEEIWKVFAEVVKRCEIKGAVLERDENFPTFTEILDELDVARRLLETKFEVKANI
ncbi:MAG TPA: DUF692 domain-containing protein [Pyrinomonadaceae bacterium]|nr:DUF692 domain-containing protein [Pyrinomonadaceae bacterium]